MFLLIPLHSWCLEDTAASYDGLLMHELSSSYNCKTFYGTPALAAFFCHLINQSVSGGDKG